MAGFTELWPGGPLFEYGGNAFSLGMDSLLLADFASRRRAGCAADLGCGSGIIALLLLWDNPSLDAVGVELLPVAADAARANMAANGLAERCGIITGDIRRVRELLPAGGFDLVVSNPPYFPAGSGAVSADASLASARSEADCTIDDVCRAASWLCRNGGDFAVVHRPERLAEVVRAMSGCGLEPKRLRFVSPTAEDAPSLMLISGKKNAKPGLRVEAPLILRRADGAETDELRRIYHNVG